MNKRTMAPNDGKDNYEKEKDGEDGGRAKRLGAGEKGGGSREGIDRGNASPTTTDSGNVCITLGENILPFTL